MSLADKLKNIKTSAKRSGPVWRGPEEDGITYSLLCRFLCCRERFRLLVVEGLKPAETFNQRLEYGNMWHVCEECLAGKGDSARDWEGSLRVYATGLCKKYPTQQDQVDKWYNVCKVQFPIYVDYWAKHPDVVDRTPLLQECPFNVPYKLPSGRVVRLRGKFDSVDLIGKGKTAGIYLQENKSKGDIDEIKMHRQLSFDLQTMIYLVALSESDIPIRDLNKPYMGYDPEKSVLTENQLNGLFKKAPIRGVRYNVIRRPLSGGRGTIVQHKPTKKNPLGESKEAYYDRLRGIIDGSAEDAPGPGYFFMRWKTEITSSDVEKFRRTCLDPILEQLCDWWAFIAGGEVQAWSGPHIHWRHPFGVYNVLDEGGSSDLDEYLQTGNEVGLTRTDNLFPELPS